MGNKEFLSSFSRHMLKTAARETEEKAERKGIKKATEELDEKKEAEALLKTVPEISVSALSPISAGPPAKPAALPTPTPIPERRISEQEVSLRKEIEEARKRVMERIIPLPLILPPLELKPPIKKIERAELDLGKLNIFLKNPEINVIECNGPGAVLVIRKGTQSLTTTVMLSAEEIEDIIKKFSTVTRTEITPLFKSTFFDLIITAFISPIIGTRFLIYKKS